MVEFDIRYLWYVDVLLEGVCWRDVDDHSWIFKQMFRHGDAVSSAERLPNDGP